MTTPVAASLPTRPAIVASTILVFPVGELAVPAGTVPNRLPVTTDTHVRSGCRAAGSVERQAAVARSESHSLLERIAGATGLFVGWFTLPTGLVLVPGGVLGDPMVTLGGAVIAAVGAIATGISIGANRNAVRRTNSELTKTTTRDVATLERAIAETKGVERAWLALRALDAATALGADADPQAKKTDDVDAFGRVLARMYPTLARASLAKKLVQLGAAFHDASETERAEALVVRSIARDVGCHANGSGAQPSRRLLGGAGCLESIIARVEGLSAPGRALLVPEISDAVVVELSASAANRYRLARFEQALRGERVAYSMVASVEPTDRLDLATLREARKDDANTVYRTATSALEALSRALLRNARHARVSLGAPEIAEQVAAHLERRGLRVALYVLPDRTVLTAYDPACPPPGAFVMGETAAS